MRDTSESIGFAEIQSSISDRPGIRWVQTSQGSGFVFDDDVKFFLTYPSAEGAAVHFDGNERALQLCKEIAEELNGVVVLM